MYKNFILLLLIGLLFIQCQYPEPKDTIAPTVTVIFPYNDAVISTNTQVRIEASDDDKISKVTCYLDGVSIGETKTTPYLINLNVDSFKDGLLHRIRATAEDPEKNVGTSEEIIFTIAKSVDATKPTISILNPQNGQTVQGTVRVVAIAEDDRSIEKVAFFIDGDSVSETASYPYNYDWNTAPYADSTNHTIFGKAFDGGGNTATSNAITVIIFPRDYVSGNTAPTTSVLYPRNGSSIYGTINVVAEATDDEAVERVEFYVDASLVFTDTDGLNGYSYNFNTTPFADGRTHIIYTKAYDEPGNSGLSDVISVTINSSRDVTQPTIAVVYPISNSVVSGTINVIAQASDDIGVDQVRFYIDGALGFTDSDGTNGWSYSWDTNPFADGKLHIVYAEAFDTSGNSGLSASISVTVSSNIDIVPPTAVILYPVTGSILSGIVNIVADVNDNVGVSKTEFYIDGNLSSTDSDGSNGWSYSWNTASYANGGTHIIYVKAYDLSGNTGLSATNSVTIPVTNDITPPTAIVLYPVNGSTVSGIVTITADVTDNVAVSKVEFYIDGKLLSTDTNGADTWSYNWNTATYNDGQSHSIYLKAYDTSNNVGTSGIITVTVPL